MGTKALAVTVAVVGLAVSACGGRPTGGVSVPNGTVMLPAVDSDLVMFATMPKNTIGEELPKEGLGRVYSKKWKALLGGFTQQNYSQSLGFPPHTTITIRNLSSSITHTLDVVKEINGPPAIFPKNPKLSVGPQGDKKLGVGYASGAIKPGKSVTVELVKAGIYLIGCAYHYNEGMRDVIVVANNAAPGVQATPPPTPRNSPTPRSSYAP